MIYELSLKKSTASSNTSLAVLLEVVWTNMASLPNPSPSHSRANLEWPGIFTFEGDPPPSTLIVLIVETSC